ncbi:MAG TPA: GNAT family N-acetyltransferase, partial [Azospira sp.]|nr:GNAT family N-acetyltransferase [Azospira sp.]
MSSGEGGHDMAAVQRIGQYLPGVVSAPMSTRVRCVTAADITPADVQAWGALEAEALQPNAYMSPHFVLPALRYLDRPRGAVILLVERVGGGAAQMVAVAVIHRVGAARLLPLPHHAMYQSRHSYLGSPLLHRDHGGEAALALFEGLARYCWSSAGLILPNVDPAGPLLATLKEAWAARGLVLQPAFELRRAALIPAQAGPESLRRRKKYKDLERCRRRLAEQGDVQWLMHRQAVDADIVESFLRLENSGWKGERQKSLRSRANDEAFFREVVAAFGREGRVFFTEVRLNGQAIASTSNFVSAQAGFAFKIGVDEAYRKYCVGMLNDAELVNQAPQVCGDLSFI